MFRFRFTRNAKAIPLPLACSVHSELRANSSGKQYRSLDNRLRRECRVTDYKEVECSLV
jgi:hypothetical protein